MVDGELFLLGALSLNGARIVFLKGIVFDLQVRDRART